MPVISDEIAGFVGNRFSSFSINQSPTGNTLTSNKSAVAVRTNKRPARRNRVKSSAAPNVSTNRTMFMGLNSSKKIFDRVNIQI